MLTAWTIRAISPFGLLAVTSPGADIYAVPTPVLESWVAEHHVVILRGFEPLTGDALPEFCETLGEIQEWELDPVNDVDTTQEVPLHWEGAFVGRIPRYLFFHCDEAPPIDAGGETLFCDTTRLLRRTAPEDRELLEQIQITYGGTLTSPLLALHPVSGETTIRYAEPILHLRPPAIRISGVIEDALEAFIEEIHQRLLDPTACYTHTWQSGDIIIADNHALLYGRRPSEERAPRQIRRVNIL